MSDLRTSCDSVLEVTSRFMSLPCIWIDPCWSLDKFITNGSLCFTTILFGIIVPAFIDTSRFIVSGLDAEHAEASMINVRAVNTSKTGSEILGITRSTIGEFYLSQHYICITGFIRRGYLSGRGFGGWPVSGSNIPAIPRLHARTIKIENPGSRLPVKSLSVPTVNGDNMLAKPPILRIAAEKRETIRGLLEYRSMGIVKRAGR